MSGGGGSPTQTQTTEPWSGVQPYLRTQFREADRLRQMGGPDYFPGQTYTDVQQEQLAPFQYGFGYMSNVFGTPMPQANYGGPADYTQSQGSQANYSPATSWSGPSGPGDFYQGGGLNGMLRSIGDWQNYQNWDQQYQQASMPVAGQNDNYDGSGFGAAFRQAWDQHTAAGGTPYGQVAQGGQGSTQQFPFQFGSSPSFGLMSGANNQLLMGQTPGAQMAGMVNPLAMQNLAGMFGGPQNLIGNWQSGFQNQLQPWNFQGQAAGPQATPFNFNQQAAGPQATPFNFNQQAAGPQETQFNSNQQAAGPEATPWNFNQQAAGPEATGFNFSPSLGLGGMDPSGAINQMLSGQPNYEAVEAATRAGAQPALDIFSEEILPQLRSRTVSSNNPTGELKDLNRIVPRLNRDIANMGSQNMMAEYNRAMGSRDQAAGLAGQLGLGLSGQGLQAAQFGSNLGQQYQNMLMGNNQFNAGLGLQADQFGANLGQQYQNMLMGNNQFNAGLGAQTDQFGANLGQDYQRMLMANNQFNVGTGLQANQFGANLGQDYQRMLMGNNQFNVGTGLQAAQFGSNLGQDYQRMLMGNNQFNTGLGLDSAQFGANLGENYLNRGLQDAQFNASLGLQGDQAQQSALDQYRQQVLGLGGLGGQFAGMYSNDLLGGLGQYGNTIQTGMMPSQMLAGYGDFVSGFENQALQDAISRWNYQQQQPYANQDWFAQQLGAAAGLGGTTTGQSSGGGSNGLGQAIGTAMTLASLFPSDRRLKRNIQRIGSLKGYPLYQYEYIWGQPGVGVMADEIPAQFVSHSMAGHAMVDYASFLRA